MFAFISVNFETVISTMLENPLAFLISVFATVTCCFFIHKHITGKLKSALEEEKKKNEKLEDKVTNLQSQIDKNEMKISIEEEVKKQISQQNKSDEFYQKAASRNKGKNNKGILQDFFNLFK